MWTKRTSQLVLPTSMLARGAHPKVLLASRYFCSLTAAPQLLLIRMLNIHTQAIRIILCSFKDSFYTTSDFEKLRFRSMNTYCGVAWNTGLIKCVVNKKKLSARLLRRLARSAVTVFGSTLSLCV